MTDKKTMLQSDANELEKWKLKFKKSNTSNFRMNRLVGREKQIPQNQVLLLCKHYLNN